MQHWLPDASLTSPAVKLSLQILNWNLAASASDWQAARGPRQVTALSHSCHITKATRRHRRYRRETCKARKSTLSPPPPPPNLLLPASLLSLRLHIPRGSPSLIFTLEERLAGVLQRFPLPRSSFWVRVTLGSSEIPAAPGPPSPFP